MSDPEPKRSAEPSNDDAVSPSGATRPDESEGATKGDASEGQRKGGFVTWLKETALTVVIVAVLMSLIRLFVFQMFVIPSGSMENTLDVGDRIVVPKFVSYHRGDIVVFADPGGWLSMPTPQRSAPRAALEFVGLAPDTSANYLVKRIIGMPGDRVKCCSPDGRITVNGVELDETSYLYRQDGVPVAPSDFPFEVVVPAGRVFVMGDHRNNSDDSRCHLQALGLGAFVPEDKIKGVAAVTLYPLNRIHTLTTPATFADVPAPASVPTDPEIHAEQVTCH